MTAGDDGREREAHLRLTPLTRAAGQVLARDLPAPRPGGIPLLRAGATIPDRFLPALAARGIRAVWIVDELSEGIEPAELMPEEVRAAAAADVARSLDVARTAFADGQRVPPTVLEDLGGLVTRISDSIVADADAALAISDLAAADQYTHRHSVDVAALGLLLGREHLRRNGWTDYRGRRRWDGLEQRLVIFGLGLLLHDVGKMAVPAPVLDKDGPLSAEEWTVMRTHPEAGAALLPSTMSALVLAVVRQHHERWDGSGYPSGLAGTGIHELARIAAVADVFDAVTSERPYKAAEPAHVGVGVIVRGRGTLFDPEVVDTFRRIVMPYPVGSEVELPDGRRGVVADVDPARPEAPVVRAPLHAGGAEELAVDLREPLAAPA